MINNSQLTWILYEMHKDKYPDPLVFLDKILIGQDLDAETYEPVAPAKIHKWELGATKRPSVSSINKYWQDNKDRYEVEQLASSIKIKRNELLAETDFLMNPDYPMSATKRKQFKEYRQALRDITKQDGYPNSVVWPTKPEI